MVFTTSQVAYTFGKAILDSLHIKKNNEDNVPSKATIKPDDPLRRVCDIDYGKFDAIVESIEEEEKLQKAEKKAEKANYEKSFAACAHDHSRERQIYEKPTEEKLKAAERFHTLGNEAYKTKNYGLAALNYRKALLQFDYSFPETESETQWMNREKLAAHLNMSACKIAQEDWEEALTQCRLALTIDPRNAKAFYRRGLVYLHLDQFEKAHSALTSALDNAPNDVTILSTLAQLKKKKSDYHTKKRKVYSAMFSAKSDKTSASNAPTSASKRPFDTYQEDDLNEKSNENSPIEITNKFKINEEVTKKESNNLKHSQSTITIPEDKNDEQPFKTVHTSFQHDVHLNTAADNVSTYTTDDMFKDISNSKKHCDDKNQDNHKNNNNDLDELSISSSQQANKSLDFLTDGYHGDIDDAMNSEDTKSLEKKEQKKDFDDNSSHITSPSLNYISKKNKVNLEPFQIPSKIIKHQKHQKSRSLSTLGWSCVGLLGFVNIAILIAIVIGIVFPKRIPIINYLHLYTPASLDITQFNWLLACEVFNFELVGALSVSMVLLSVFY